MNKYIIYGLDINPIEIGSDTTQEATDYAVQNVKNFDGVCFIKQWEAENNSITNTIKQMFRDGILDISLDIYKDSLGEYSLSVMLVDENNIVLTGDTKYFRLEE